MVIEAMSSGLPVVATGVDGTPEVVSHGIDGYLENVGDIEAQAARVTALLTDEELYKKISAAARETATSRFCSSLIIPAYEEYYKEICSS